MSTTVSGRLQVVSETKTFHWHILENVVCSMVLNGEKNKKLSPLHSFILSVLSMAPC